MKNTIAKIACFAFIAAALVAAPAISRAEDSTNAPAATPKKHTNLPFKGKVVSVDAAAMTFMVGTMTIAISSTTKITKDGQPAVFADITAGEMVTGSYKKDAEGKLDASSVKIGQPKKAKSEKAAPGTNAPPAQ